MTHTQAQASAGQPIRLGGGLLSVPADAERQIMPNMGTKMPEMSMKGGAASKSHRPVGLGDALFTTTQQRLLALLFGQSHRSFFSNELIRLTGSGSGAVQRELARLSSCGLVTSREIGSQRHFQANAASPIFNELVQIVHKTFGVAQPIRAALEPYEPRIKCAFIFGSVAKHTDTAASDLDLFVVSDTLTHPDLINALLSAEVKLLRGINTTIYSSAELREKAGLKNAFVLRVLEQPKIWVIGNEQDL
jgi:predicted nucleotidyltransferase